VSPLQCGGGIVKVVVLHAALGILQRAVELVVNVLAAGLHIRGATLQRIGLLHAGGLTSCRGGELGFAADGGGVIGIKLSRLVVKVVRLPETTGRAGLMTPHASAGRTALRRGARNCG